MASSATTEMANHDQKPCHMDRVKKFFNIAIRKLNPLVNSQELIEEFIKNLWQFKRHHEMYCKWTNHFRLKLAIHTYCFLLHAVFYVMDFDSVTQIFMLDITYLMFMNNNFKFVNLIYMGLYAVAIYSDFLFYLINSRGTLYHFQLLNQTYYGKLFRQKQWRPYETRNLGNSSWNHHLKLFIVNNKSRGSIKLYLDIIIEFFIIITGKISTMAIIYHLQITFDSLQISPF